MGQQGKSYRYGKSMAPYKQHVVSNETSRASSFFKRMKRLFNNDQNNSKSNDQLNVSGREQNENESPRIPGGFFSANASRLGVDARPVILKRPGNDCSTLSRATQNVAEDNSEDAFEYANTSNAKLADFFSKKGDEPLTDIEMEGVLSLMKKASRSGNTQKRSITNPSIDDSMTFESSRVLKSSRTPSMAASSYKAPSFTPRYEDSVGSQSLGNASLRSTSSRRRVFDYSSFPTPYKTVVYKYSAADTSSVKVRISPAVPSETLTSDLDLSSKSNNAPTQRLSNTASALVSLLEGNQPNKTSSAYSNPYSSYIDPIREYKKNASLQLANSNAIPSNSLRSDALEKIQDAKEEHVPQVLPKQRQKAQHKAPSEKYKPVRSSSLRSSIVSAPVGESDQKVDHQVETKSVVPTAARFDFTLEGKTKEKEQTEEIQTQKLQLNLPLFHSHAQSKDAASLPNHKANLISTDVSSKKEPITFSFHNAEQIAAEPGNAVKTKPDSQGKISVFSQKSPEVEPERFDLGEPSPSGINSDLLDSAKVEKFKLAFIFD